MEWALGVGGGRRGEGSFLGWYAVGDGKIPFFLMQIQKKLTKIGYFHQTLKSPKLARIKNIILKLQIQTNITRNWK
jgi:hypothetical protein